MSHSISDFSSRLISWQLQHGRHGLPWQRADAYRVWLSEIMLQQTQVATVLPYYQRFIAAFPTIAALAAASQEQVLAHWSGLGYYARGRNLHRAAQLIAEKYHGEFPRQYEQILELPGIGRSTAAAICALAWHEHRAILEGNVKRVLARHRGIEGSPSSKAVEAQLWQQAEALLPQQSPQSHQSPLPHREITNDLAVVFGQPSQMASSSIRARERVNAGEEVEAQPTSTPILAFPLQGGRDRLVSNKQIGEHSAIATYTQALMDLGATLCTRSKPKCGECPVQADCVARQTNRVHELPTPRPHKAVPEKHTTFLLLLHGNDILLEKRAPSGIWGGLWCPPQLEDEQVAGYLQRSGVAVSKKIEGRRSGAGRNPANSINQCEALPTFTHTFTHFKLHITPLLLRVAHKPLQAQQPGSVWLDVEEALQAAIPTPVRRVLRELLKGHP